MEKVIAFDTASTQFRVYFPKCETILASVRALPVRRFHKDWNDPYWIAGADVATASALANLAFNNDFVVCSVAAAKIQAAMSGVAERNIKGFKAAGTLSCFEVRTAYNETIVAMLKSCAGSTMDSTKTWKLPVHTSSIRIVISLVRDFGLTIEPSVLESAQSVLKKNAADGFIEVCREVDTVIELCESRVAQRAPRAMPPLAVLDASIVANWMRGSAARREKCKEQAGASRTGARAAQRAMDRGFEEEAALMTRAQIAAVHRNLQTLAGVCDGAATQDDVGFNGPDAKVGRGLALLPVLEPIHAALARAMLQKYTRQLGKEAIEQMS
jgi:hypothetical protein